MAFLGKINCVITVVILGTVMLFCLSKKTPSSASVPVQNKTVYSLSPNFKFIEKQDKVLNNFVESTPFVWKGSLKYLVSERTIQAENPVLAIYDYESNTKLVQFGSGLSFASALVDDQTLYIFATKNRGVKGKSEIFLLTSTDLKNFSNPKLVLRAQEKQGFFNTSVTKNSDKNEFIMAVETDEDKLVAFNIRFYSSNNLSNWQLLPVSVFGPDVYVACPTIRYINSEYYMWFLMEEYNNPNCKECLTYVVKVVKSKDLSNWEISPHYFLVPDRPDEGINTSDPDIAEFNGKVYIFYSVGDQATWAKLKTATFDGNLQELVRQFFYVK